MTYPKVYIILLNYNGWIDMIECLESVLRNDYPNYQVIVVDNNSPNNSMEYLKAWAEGKLNVWVNPNNSLRNLSFPPVSKPIPYIYYTRKEAEKGGSLEIEEVLKNKMPKDITSKYPLVFIQSGDNLGFAGGNNIGIRYALVKNDFEYIWLLNNDTVIKKDALKKLIEFAEKNNTGISGSVLMYYDSPNTVQTYGGHINKFLGTSHRILKKEQIKDKLNYIVGASFLINRKVIEKIGLLPEDYFLYYEETDYCFNASKNGFSLGVALDSVVYHKEGQSTGANKKLKSEIDALSLTNRIKFHKKYLGGGIGLWLGMVLAFFIRIGKGQVDTIWKMMRINKTFNLNS
jgi:GT2 family glycosyltransferase